MDRVIRHFEGMFGRLVLAEPAAAAEPGSHPWPSVLLLYDGAPAAYEVGDGQIALGREDVLLLNAHEAHRGLPGPGAGASRVLALIASGDWLARAFPGVFASAARRPFPHRLETITPRLRRLADALALEVLNDRFLSPERLEFMLQELVLTVVDAYFGKRRSSAALWRGSRFQDSRIRRAVALLRARPHKDFNMDDLASQVGLSRSRFYDLFQLCTGHSPRSYLDMLCVESAIGKLASGSAKIGEVSRELGFSAQSNFTRFFLNQVGVSPSEYRRVAARPGGADAAASPDSPEPQTGS
jgi:AraC-like DNA-binding protein